MWNPSQRDAVAATAAKLVEHEAKVKADKAASSGGQPLTGMDKLAKENLDQEMEALNTLDKTFKDNTYQVTQIHKIRISITGLQFEIQFAKEPTLMKVLLITR